jgi:hypothetical protein
MPVIPENEARGSEVQDQPGLHCETLSLKTHIYIIVIDGAKAFGEKLTWEEELESAEGQVGWSHPGMVKVSTTLLLNFHGPAPKSPPLGR